MTADHARRSVLTLRECPCVQTPTPHVLIEDDDDNFAAIMGAAVPASIHASITGH
jgi:hypothetical protein